MNRCDSRWNPPPPSDDNLDDLQQDLQKLLDEFRVPTVAFSPTRAEQRESLAPTTQGLDESEATSLEHLDGDVDVDSEIERRLHANARRASPTKRVRRAPDGATLSKEAKALERVPVIEILVDDDEIAAKAIVGRAGKYY